MLVTESGSNLYFTDTRAQSALSGTVSTINATLSGLTNSINTLSGAVYGFLSGTTYQPQIDTLSGQVINLNNQVIIFAATLAPIVTTVNTFS